MYWCVHDESFSCVHFFVNPWTFLAWNFPAKNSRVGCHFQLQYVSVQVSKSFRLKKKMIYMVNVIYIKCKVYVFIFLDNQIGSRKMRKYSLKL